MLLKYLAPAPDTQRPWSMPQYEEIQLQVSLTAFAISN